MPAQEIPDQPGVSAACDATRANDLSELLGYTNTAWDDERRALARQLHDSMGSSLTALTMHLSLLAHKMPAEPALQDRAAQMKQLLLNVIDTNRQMQLRLWNDKLEFLGVTVALAELANQFGELEQIKVVCSFPEEELSCPRGHSVALLRTLEAALANIKQHAQASTIDIILDDNDDATTLTVKDNGVGLMPGHAQQPGTHSLRAVRERAAYLGGSLQLTANPAGGTILTVTLPKAAA